MVKSIRWGDNSNSDRLHLTLDGDLPAADLGDLALEVNGYSFLLSEACTACGSADDDSNYTWDGRSPRLREDLPTGSTTTVKLIDTSGGTTASTDATLSALALEDDDSTAITLSPTFASGTTAYYAWVANSIDSVTLTATKNDDGATVAITDDDDTSTPGEAALDLDVGANTLTVTVTAEDSNTTETYTVTVVREASAPTADADAIWTANLTAEQENISGLTFYSRWGLGLNILSEPFGAITDDDFELGGVTYEVTGLAVAGPGTIGINPSEQDKIRFCFASAPGVNTDNWILHLDNLELRLQDATKATNCFVWPRGTLSWELGDIVLVKMSLGNYSPTGKPGIDGTPQAGQTLTATAGTMADGDNLPTTTFPTGYTFQWVQVDGMTETNVGTDSHQYTLVAGDVGKTLKVKVTFTDGGNTVETLTSDRTDAVIAAQGACPANNDWCANMTVGIGDESTTYYGYSNGTSLLVPRIGGLDDTSIDYDTLDYTVYTLTFHDRISTDRFDIRLDAFVPSGTVFNFGGTTFTADASSEQAATGQYFWDTTTDPGWIDGQKVTVSANLAPVVTGATVNGDQLTLTFAEDLDTNSKPAASAFTVYIAGDTTGVNPSSVDTISGKTVTMTLASAVTSGQTVTLDYAVPTSNPLQDESGIEAPDFTGQTVTNNTGATNTAATGKPGITGAPQRGETLTATLGTIADDDGITTLTFPGDYTFQWAKDGSDITGATDDTYDVPAATALGSTFTVKVSFSDDDGNAEGPLESDATPGTVDAPEDCTTDRPGNDWCATMTVGSKDILGSIYYGYSNTVDHIFGSLDDTSISYGGQSYTVMQTSNREIAGGGRRHVVLDAFLPHGSTFDIGGMELTANASSEQLTVGTYRWDNATWPGWHDGQKVTVSANLAPIVTGATVNGDQLTLTFAEDLDTNSKPAASAFTIYIAGDTTGVNPSSVDTISGTTVTMTLASAVTSGQTVTIDYAVPGTNPLQDESGIEAPGFTGQAVTNNTGATNTAATGAPAITGTAWVGETLTAGIGTLHDPDGLPATAFPDGYTLQWYRVDADGSSNRQAIPGATGATYTLTDDDDGKKIRLQASFTDADGNLESRESDPWPAGGATVIAAGDATVLLDTTLTVANAGTWNRHFGCSSTSDAACEDRMADITFTSTDRGVPKQFAVDGLQLSKVDKARNADGEVVSVPAFWNLQVWFAGVRELRDYEVRNLVLELDGEAFEFRNADAGGYHLRQWQRVGLRWSRGDSVAVRILDLRTSQQQAPLPPLTVELDDAPGSHDGTGSFTFRLAFSEDVDISPGDMRDHALLVTGGTVTGAAPAEDGKNDLWEITVQPAGDADIAILIPAGRPCTEQGALCTADGRMLSGAVPAVSVRYVAPAQEAQADPNALTAAFENAPAEHDGTSAFTIELAFTHPVFDGTEDFDKNQAVQDAIQVTNGTIRGRRRAQPRQYDRWKLWIRPSGNGNVTVTLPATTGACTGPGAICTPDGRPLAADAAATIEGPPGLAVADAGVQEEPGATLEFAVTLSRASASEVTVDYATADGSARAGDDYTATSGTLRFLPGETEKTVSVPVLDDSVDEDPETMTLTLSNPSGANAWLSDATATGTIRNSDLMPQAWLARFGRTVAEQVLDAVRDRLRGPPAPGVQVTIAGERIGSATGDGKEDPESEEARRKALEEAEAKRKLAALSAWLRGDPGSGSGAGADEQEQDRRAGYRRVEPRELLTGSSFQLTAAAEGMGGGLASLWGRSARSSFDGREGDLSLSGEVTSALLGADWSREKWTMGLMLSHARGEGSWRGGSGGAGPGPRAGGTGGKVESTLAGLYPYGRYRATDRVTLWGTAGYGAGELVLKPDEGDELKTDMDLMMAAAGLRGVAVKAPAQGGPEVAMEADALAVRTRSEALRTDTGNLAAATGDATRLRLALHGAWRGLEAGGGTLEPRLELGLRHDGGDAETGFGLDAGAGLAWSHPENGLRLELSGRGLLTHESNGFREQGLAGSLTWQPTPERGRGPKLTLTQTLGGASSGGAGALLGRRTLEGLAANDPGSGSGAGGRDPLESRNLELRLGYGFPALGDRFTATPEIGLGMSNGHREYGLGWRLNLATHGTSALEFALEATRREAAGPGPAGAEPEHAIGLRITARW